MDETQGLGSHTVPDNLPASITELLARPRLVDLPENPVGAVLGSLQEAFPDFSPLELPEELDLQAAERKLGGDAVYIDRSALQRICGERVLRYDMTLPLLLAFRWNGNSEKLTTVGKVYRREHESATHLQAFHQLELFLIENRAPLPSGQNVDLFWMAGRILNAIDRTLPNVEVRRAPTEYPMCRRPFSLDVRHAERWIEVLALGEYADWVIRALGADPEHQIALGAGFGLERIAALRYGIDDIRKVAGMRV